MRFSAVQDENGRERSKWKGWRGLLYPFTQNIAVEAL
jgi:hypothetical protein